MQSRLTPGVYYERVDASAPAISVLRTDISGFVGIATRGPLNQALPVQSFRQFQAYFGDFTGAGYLAYAVRAFFDNGGQRCWIVRVASELAANAGTVFTFAGPTDAWRISASSPGVWGNDLEVVLRETHRAQTLTEPESSTNTRSAVTSVTGFIRSSHVRLSQGATTVYKVVSDVDPVEGQLIWRHSQPESRLPYDSDLSGFDPDQPILIESVEYTLLVKELGRLVRVYEGLSLVPENPLYGPSVLGPLQLPQFGRNSLTLPASPEPVVIEELRSSLSSVPGALALVIGQSIRLSGGADGLALLRTFDFVGEEVDSLDSDEIKRQRTRGLRALAEISEVSVLAVPDINIQPQPTAQHLPPPPCIPDPCLPPPPPVPVIRAPSIGDLPPKFSDAQIFQVQSAMIQQCEALRDRIALLDPPFNAAQNDKLGIGSVRAWRSRFDSKYAAFYYPWLRVVDPLRITSITRDIPPSGHVGGQYAQTDFRFGVHKAPANLPLTWVQDVTIGVDDSVQGILNPLGINAIRPLPGRGIRIYGARTVSSDPDWIFVNVRRLMMMIEKAIDVAIQWAIFEPNDTLTRSKINLVLTSFLLSLFQRGALTGASANEAFFVKCDDENNPPDARANGQMLAQVGVAPTRPFEFIVLHVGRVHNQFEITEASSLAMGSGAV